MTVITNIEDLRRLAVKRVPRMFYDYADSGSWTESRQFWQWSYYSKRQIRQQRLLYRLLRRSFRPVGGSQVRTIKI